MESPISLILIVANIESSVEEALSEKREFFGERTGSGGAAVWESRSVFAIEFILSQIKRLTYCSLLLGILACLNLCYGQERRLSFVGL